MCDKLDITKLVTFNKDFDAKLVPMFFATVHLKTNEERTITWMTNGRRPCATWKEFMYLMGDTSPMYL